MNTATHPSDINTGWAQAFNAGDVESMLDLYEPDAVLVPGPGQEPVTGRTAIEGNLRWLVGLGGKITFTPRHWLVNGDLALGSIDFHLSGGTADDGNPVELRGGTAEVARLQPNGSWKYVFDHPFAVPLA